jgi:hypothetical protein
VTKTTAGESRCPASLASAASRLLVQQGCGNEALLLVRSDRSEAARRWLVMAGEATEGRSRVRVSFLGDVWRRDKGGGQSTGGGDREQGGDWDRATVPDGQNGNGPLTGGPGLEEDIFRFPNSTQICKFKKELFP